jgi:hypothetical protein
VAALGRTKLGRPFLWNGVGRLAAIGMTKLSLILLVVDQTGSVGLAGATTAAYSLGKLSNIFKSVLVDRRGVGAILVPLSVAHAIALTALALLVIAGGEPARWMLVVAGALIGACEPPLPETMRAYINRSHPAATAKETNQQATRLDTLITEASFGLGPLIVGGLVLVISPAVALFPIAALTLLGTLRFVRTAGISPIRSSSSSPPAEIPASSSRSVRLQVLMGAMFLWTFAYTSVEIAVPAFAVGRGEPALSGLLLGIGGVGSVVGGLWYLLQVPTERLESAIARWAALFGASIWLMAAFTTPVVLGSALFAFGFLATCVVACVYKRAAMTDISSSPRMTTVQSLVLGSSIAGMGVGQLTAAAICDSAGVTTALVVAGGAGLAASASALALGRLRY